jgi:hypothetical protein
MLDRLTRDIVRPSGSLDRIVRMAAAVELGQHAIDFPRHSTLTVV